MATDYPTAIDGSSKLPDPSASNNTNNPSLAGGQANQNDAIKAVETKLGTGTSTPANNTFLIGNGSGSSAWSSVTSAQMAARVSDETGTGSLVFANTPTLVTPAVNTINEATTANGVTIDGLNLKDGKLNTNDSVVTANVTNAAITPPKWTNPYKFGIYRNAALTASTGAWTLLVFDTVSFDTGSNVTIGTGRFTAPVAGFYQFNANATVATNSTTVVGLSFYKNGSQAVQAYYLNFTSANATTSMPGSAFLQLAANDYVQVYYYSNGAGAFGVGSVYTSFQGFLVSQT